MPQPVRLTRRLGALVAIALAVGGGLAWSVYTPEQEAANPGGDAAQSATVSGSGSGTAPEAARDLAALATGAMSKLVVHESAKGQFTSPFRDGDGAEITLADFAGKVVVVNFWATWCPPCRAEMPALDRLAAKMAEDALPVAVIAVSTDFGTVEKSRRFYEDTGISTLGLYHDASRGLAREAAILGLPVTLILDRDGREVARLVGDAEWDSEETVAVLQRLVDMTDGGAS